MANAKLSPSDCVRAPGRWARSGIRKFQFLRNRLRTVPSTLMNQDNPHRRFRRGKAQPWRRSLANIECGSPLLQAQGTLQPRAGVWGARIKWGQNPLVEGSPKGPCTSPPGPICPCLGRALGLSLGTCPAGQRVCCLFPFFPLFPDSWLINDARGVTPISLGYVIPKSDWGDCRR